jgi:hypothetical protein
VLALLVLIYFASVFVFPPADTFSPSGMEYHLWMALFFFLAVLATLLLPDLVWLVLLVGNALRVLVFKFLFPRWQLLPPAAHSTPLQSNQPSLPLLHRLLDWDLELTTQLIHHPYLGLASVLFAVLAILIALPARDYLDLLAIPFLLLSALAYVKIIDRRMFFALGVALLLLSGELMVVNDRLRGEMSTVLFFYTLLCIFLVQSGRELLTRLKSLVMQTH